LRFQELLDNPRRVDAFVDMKRDILHFNAHTLFFARPVQCRVDMRVMLISGASVELIGGGRNQPYRRIVFPLLAVMGIVADFGAVLG